MKEQLYKRMDILQMGNVICEDTACFMRKVIDRMIESYPEMTQDKLESFTTHLAMATERIRRGEYAEALERDVWEEVLEDDAFEEANGILDFLKGEIGIEIPDSESEFLMIHLCNLLHD